MGCQIVARLLAVHPKDAHRQILLAPTVFRKERTIALQAVRLLQNSFYETIETSLTILADYMKMGVYRYLKTVKWMVEDRIEDNLRDTAILTLVVRGKNDHIVPHDWLSYLTTLSANISMAEVPDAPHGLQHKFPKKLATLCRTFIEN